MYLFNGSGGSPAVLVFLIIQNSGYRPALKTLNTPGTKVFGSLWRGYLVLLLSSRLVTFSLLLLSSSRSQLHPRPL
jgi:hypothetical protein